MSEEQSGSDPGRTRQPYPLHKMLLAALSLALFATILWFGGAESWRTVLMGDPRLYLAAFLLSGAAPGLSAWRLRTFVQSATGNNVASWRRYFHINMTAISLGIFLPRNAALMGSKAAYLRATGVPLLRGTWAIVMENVLDLLFLLAIASASLLVIVAGVGSRGFLAANAACGVLLLAAVLWTRGRDWRGAIWALAQRVPFVSSRLPTPEGGFVPGPVRALPMLGATVLIHVILALRAYAIALAMGLEPSWLVFAAAYPVTQLGLAVAVAPGALGTLDASWLGLLILLGVSGADALSFTVALRACIVAFPIIWYGVSAGLALTIRSDPGEDDLRMGPTVPADSRT